MKLTYNNVSRKTNNTPGVEISLPEFGGTVDMEWVDDSLIKNYDFGAYFTYIAEALVKRRYVRGETLFGAPYDFRKGPSEFNFKILLSGTYYNFNTVESL